MKITQFTVIFLCLMFCALTIIASTTCDGKSGVTCCFGYKWSKEYQACIKCSPGYFGNNCSQICPYPTYGDKCKNVCNCDPDACRHDVGCIIKMEETSTQLATKDQKTKSTDKTEKVFTTPRSPTTVGTTFKGEIYHNDSSTLSDKKLESIHQTYPLKNPNSEKGNVLLIATLVGVVAILLLLLCIIIGYVVKQARKACRILKSKNPKKPVSDTDHYNCLEDVEPLLPYDTIKGSVFNGLAEVKINFDIERKQYILGLRTQSDEKELQTTTSMNKQNLDTVKLPVLASDVKGAASCAKEYSNYDEPNGNIDVKVNFERHESTASYLLVLPDNDSGDCTSCPSGINCTDKQN